MDDQLFYDIVALELQSRMLRTGLWMRAVAETGQEGSEARALYIRLRVAELIREKETARLRSKAQQQELQERAKRQEQARREKFKPFFVLAFLLGAMAFAWLIFWAH